MEIAIWMRVIPRLHLMGTIYHSDDSNWYDVGPMKVPCVGFRSFAYIAGSENSQTFEHDSSRVLYEALTTTIVPLLCAAWPFRGYKKCF